MNITKFLLIDLVLVFAIIPIFFSIQRKKNNSFFLENLNESKKKDGQSIKIPTQKEILQLETLAQKKGTGIEFNSLIGIWRFISVWRSGSKDENKISNSLLRFFSASLELKQNIETKDSPMFNIVNSIQFGELSIKFQGSGDLKGSQPILPFFFKEIVVKLGTKTLFRRSLDIPKEGNRPFFSLIGMEENGQWLAARGRGGGLAVWIKE